jgi:uncharacterized protein (TIGR03086 family)
VTDIADLHDRALQATGRVVAAIETGRQHDDTPCEGMDVRTLLNHVVSGNLWVAPLVEGRTIEEVGDRYDGDVVGHDFAGSYDESAAAAGAAFHRPGALDAPVAVSYGPVPGRVYAGHRFLDVLVHGWDLAKATGQDTTLDPELVEACWDLAQREADMVRGSGVFGEEVPVPHDAPLQDRLLAFLGRRA